MDITERKHLKFLLNELVIAQDYVTHTYESGNPFLEKENKESMKKYTAMREHLFAEIMAYVEKITTT